jgi:recombination protein RecA
LDLLGKADDRRPTTDDKLSRTGKQSYERRLEQVLKTTDLILQSAGFGLVALDLAGIAEKFVRRIPLASWFRFQRAVEHTKTMLLVVSECPCAQTCAALGVKLSAFSSQPSGKPAHAHLLESIRVEAEIVRSRLERKPMKSVRATFESKAVRAG